MATAQSAEGIILRKYLLRETSYILVVYTKEFGKIKGVVKGVRNPYPQFAGDFEIFTRCQLLFYKKKKKPMDLITQCNALEVFLEARKDIERLTYANYFIELIDVVTKDHDEDQDVYNILLESLRMLSSGASARRVSRIFELKLLGALGLTPQLTECVKCGKSAKDAGSFSVRSGGLLCPGCKSPGDGAMKLSMGTVNFMKKIQVSDIERTSLIKVSSEVGKETERVLKRYLQYHINRPIRSMKFLESLRGIGIK